MKIVCPCCGETIETELDVVDGQHVICPACDQKFTYGSGTEDPALDAKAEEPSVQSNAIAIKCPHCGTEYEAERSDFGRFVACEECGEGFVIGQTGERKDDKPVKEQGKKRRAVAVVGAFSNAVSEEIGKVAWRKHWDQAQRAAENTAKTIRGKLDEIDWEKHRKQAKDAARDGAALGGVGLRKAHVVARTFWQNFMAAPIVVKVICCLLMAKGIGAFCHLYDWGGLFGLPALIVNTTFTSMGVMVWEELISAAVFLIVFPYAVLKKRTWVGKAVVVTFVVTQLMCLVIMIFTLGFNARLLREILFSWENICLIAALVMLSMKSVRVWFGVNSDESGGKICLNAVRRDVVAWMRRNPLMVGVAGVLIGLLCMTLVMPNKGDCHLGSNENRQGLDRTAKYRQAKVWYQKQLDYNGLTESWFSYKKDRKSGDSYWLDLSADGGGSVEISLENGEWFKWPKSMPKGFAKELIDARITIFNYEDSDAGVRSATWRSGKKYMD